MSAFNDVKASHALAATSIGCSRRSFHQAQLCQRKIRSKLCEQQKYSRWEIRRDAEGERYFLAERQVEKVYSNL
jgi:hypothetical protein